MKPLFNAAEIQAFQGFWRQSFPSFRAKLLILTIIASSFLIFIIPSLLWQPKSGQWVCGGGLLLIGSFIAGIIQWIAAIFESDRQKIRFKLVFPLSRKVYFIGNFLVALRDGLGLLIATSFFGVLELLSVQLVKVFRPELVFANPLNLKNYWSGLWTSLSLIMLLYTFAYCLGIYFSSAKIKTWITMGILLGVFMIGTGGGPTIGGYILAAVFNLIKAQNMAVTYLKTWLFIIGIYMMAYFPIRRLEV